MATRVVCEPGWQQPIDGNVHDLLERMGTETEIDAKAACPVRTGRLRDSTEHEGDGGTVRIGNGNDVPYAGYVEEGTRCQTVPTPQPVRGEVAVTPRRLVSACPQGHPLPTLPTRWFDGVAWRDGCEACRHCYEAGDAVDRTKARSHDTVLQQRAGGDFVAGPALGVAALR